METKKILNKLLLRKNGEEKYQEPFDAVIVASSNKWVFSCLQITISWRGISCVWYILFSIHHHGRQDNCSVVSITLEKECTERGRERERERLFSLLMNTLTLRVWVTVTALADSDDRSGQEHLRHDSGQRGREREGRVKLQCFTKEGTFLFFFFFLAVSTSWNKAHILNYSNVHTHTHGEREREGDASVSMWAARVWNAESAHNV